MLPWQPILGLKLACVNYSDDTIGYRGGLLWSPTIAEHCYILVVLFIFFITVARDSGRLLYFGRVIFYFFNFFSVHQIFVVPGPIFAKICHTTRYVVK